MTSAHWHGTADELEQQFDDNADRYDLMVGLNRGYHQHLHAAARRLVATLPSSGELRLADLGCGSGASTSALLDELGNKGAAARATVVGVDASDGMLAVARRKGFPPGVEFRHGRAEDVVADSAHWRGGAELDGVLACYLFRNVADTDVALAAVHDVLAPGGWLVTQEYSVADSRRAAAVWTFVSWVVIVPLGLVLTRRTALYRYLWRSVLRFDSIGRFTDRLAAAGFEEVTVSTAPGWQAGILHTFTARRPPAA